MASPFDDVTHIGTRLELLTDDTLIDRMDSVELTLHRPVPRDVAIVHDNPWEGNICFYHTVMRDDNLFRMYYRGAHYDNVSEATIGKQVVCYAESDDGITWRKPNLNLIEFEGSKANNIIWDTEPESHNFAPFKDTNPDCPPEQRYKALGGNNQGLHAFQSADGIHWSRLQEDYAITEGAFDSQNLAFWDPNRRCYTAYHRDFKTRDGEMVRDIMTSTSLDFLDWTDPVWLDYTGVPVEHLYTNQITPYHRAPHMYMGFPKRFVPTRHPFGHKYVGVSDVVFMSSRDGVNFRRWGEALIRPGLQEERWENRNNFVAHGIVETDSGVAGTPNELTLYSMEGYYRGESCQMRRYTLRLDGFVSARAGLSGGSIVTRPLTFTGNRLLLNMSSSAAGGIRVELQHAHRLPVEKFSLDDCDDIYGDAIDKVVTWNGNDDVSALSGQPIRMRIVLNDADLYAYQFGQWTPADGLSIISSGSKPV